MSRTPLQRSKRSDLKNCHCYKPLTNDRNNRPSSQRGRNTQREMMCRGDEASIYYFIKRPEVPTLPSEFTGLYRCSSGEKLLCLTCYTHSTVLCHYFVP